MSETLKTVTRAARKRDKTCGDAYRAYVAAIKDARDAGHTLQQIADAAGLKTRESVRYLLHPDPRKERGAGDAHPHT